MAATHRPRSGRPGFTLTELLVVILIIAVLAALLTVTVTKLRASAHSANCVNNLRQMSTGLFSYLGDNNNILPSNVYNGINTTYKPDSKTLSRFIGPHMGYESTIETPNYGPIFECPAHVKTYGLQTEKAGGRPSYVVARYKPTSLPWGSYPSGTAVFTPSTLSSLETKLDDGKPIRLSRARMIQDYPETPVIHGKYINAVYFDGHVGRIDPVTFEPR